MPGSVRSFGPCRQVRDKNRAILRELLTRQSGSLFGMLQLGGMHGVWALIDRIEAIALLDVGHGFGENGNRRSSHVRACEQIDLFGTSSLASSLASLLE